MQTNSVFYVGLFVFCVCMFHTECRDISHQNDVIAGEYIVMFEKSAWTKPLLNDILKDTKILWINVVGRRAYAHVATDSKIIIKLTSHPLIASIEGNRLVRLIHPVNIEINDHKLLPKRKRHRRSSGTCLHEESGTLVNLWGLIRTSYHAKPVYDTSPYLYSNSGTGVDAYILDTGVDIKNVEFGGRASYGMVASALESEGPEDLNGHGTNVAGITAGTVYGMAKTANIISCKVLNANGTGTTSDVLQGINWVVSRVQTQKANGIKPRPIISMSLGSSYPSTLQYNAIQSAVDEGITVVVAAGNDGASTNNTYPAAFDNTFTVGASTSFDTMASFSNYGPLVDVMAPGSNIKAACSTNSPLCANAIPEQCTAFYSGTSQATPHVTGAIAIYLSSLTDNQLTQVTPTSIANMIINTASMQYITLSVPQSSTPNRLLYVACGNVPGQPTVATTTGLTTTQKSATSIKASSTTTRSTTFTTIYTTTTKSSTTTKAFSTTPMAAGFKIPVSASTLGATPYVSVIVYCFILIRLSVSTFWGAKTIKNMTLVRRTSNEMDIFSLS